MKRSKGFTLVELLVVIGIIALLISILLPALGKVRWQAQVTACGARMRDITNSVIMYANENRGYLPPMNGEEKGGAAFDLYLQDNWVYGTGATGSPIAKNDAGVLLGRLWKTRYIKTAKVFWCPSNRTELPIDNPTNRDFRYYLFNPHFKYVTDPATPGNYLLQHWWRRLPNYGRVPPGLTYKFPFSAPSEPYVGWQRAIMVDTLWNYSSGSDATNVTHLHGTRRAYNMAYPDGHVSSYTEGKYVARQTDKVERLLDISNALQAAADGKSVYWAGGWENKWYNAIPINPTGSN